MAALALSMHHAAPAVVLSTCDCMMQWTAISQGPATLGGKLSMGLKPGINYLLELCHSAGR